MKTKTIYQLSINTELIVKLDKWIKQQPVAPSRSATVEKAITDFLDKHQNKEEEEDDHLSDYTQCYGCRIMKQVDPPISKADKWQLCDDCKGKQ